MDAVETLNPAYDTTVGMIEAAQGLGWSAVYFRGEHVRLRDGEVRARGRPIKLNPDADPWFALGADRDVVLSDMDAILMRKDPPVDEAYVHLCQMLEFVPGDRVFNRPAGIIAANEKIFAQEFAAFQPPTVMTASADHARAFIDECGDAVIKPLNGMQGRSVFRVRSDDENADALIEEMTRRGERFVVVQALIPGYERGDMRVLMVDGEPAPLGLLRVPPSGKFRANMAAGGEPKTADLDERALEICAAVGPRLRESGLLFVGLDIIGGRLTEINVTSPTGMRQIDAAGAGAGARLMECLEAKVAGS